MCDRTGHVHKMDAQQELAVYTAMMRLSNDVTFVWDMASDVLSCSSKWESRFGYAPLSENFSQKLDHSVRFHPEDRLSVREEIERLRTGSGFGEVVVRIMDSSGRYTWNRIRATTECGEDGQLQKILGVIVDIDTEQRTSQALREKAEQDSLTGMLNKDAARNRIEAFLAHRGAMQQAAMLIIDLDNFKSVNDRFGHMFGDMVLTRVAGTIRRLFREKDILARIGGDEFLVFMQDIPDRELVERRCSMLTASLQQLYDHRLQDCRFSCSVGAALVPEHGTTYQELFQRADRALYHAKDRGKNTYAIYASSTRPARFETKIGPRIDSEESHSGPLGILSGHLLEHLYESRDPAVAIYGVMELLGMEMQVDRVFLTGLNDGEPALQWARDAAAYPPLAPRQKDLQAIRSLLAEEDVFYCYDSALVEEELKEHADHRSLKALLLCAVRSDGELRGAVGMESCGDARLWTRDEIASLGFLARMTSLFLWK